MQDLSIGPIVLLVVVGGGIFFFIHRNAENAGKPFNGSLILSIVATLVFALFFVGGLFLLFSNAPPGEILPGLQTWTLRAFGCGLALFGMLGLIIARGLAVLISIEHAAHTLVGGTDGVESGEAGPTAAYRFGQMIGKSIHGGE